MNLFLGAFYHDFQNIYHSTRKIENNFVASVLAPKQALNVDPQLHANNFFAQPGWGASLSALDERVAGGFSSCFDYEAMGPLNTASVGATDGFAVGIRWGGDITIEDVRNPPSDWYLRWPALEVPVAEATAPAWFNQDLR